MAQPQDGYQWTYIGTVGTVALTNRATTLVRAIVWGTYVGTIVFHDAPSATGTTATSPIGTLGLPATTVAGNIEFGASCKTGLVYLSTGTPNLTLIWN